MGGKREVRMIEGKKMEHLEDDKREKGSENGGRSLIERGGKREREATEEDGEGGKEAEDGDKSDGSMGERGR